MEPIIVDDETPRDRQETAAVELTFEVARLLSNAFYSRPDLSIEDIAERIGVTPERVCEILSMGEGKRSEGNMYVVTLGRYMRAMGYKLQLTAVVADDETSPEADADKVNEHRRRPRRLRSNRPDLQEAYLQTLPGIVYELLDSIDGGSLPFQEYLHAIQAGGFTARQGIQFINDEANYGNIRIHDDGSVSAVR